MSTYIFIESRDPFESLDTRFVGEMATALKERGHEVIVFLIQNGVLATRRSGGGPNLARLAAAGVTLLADDFSLRERGIQSRELEEGIQPVAIEALVDALVQDNTKAIWH